MADDEQQRIDRLAQTGAGHQNDARPVGTDGQEGDGPTGGIEEMTGPGTTTPNEQSEGTGDPEAKRHEEQEQDA